MELMAVDEMEQLEEAKLLVVYQSFHRDWRERMEEEFEGGLVLQIQGHNDRFHWSCRSERQLFDFPLEAVSLVISLFVSSDKDYQYDIEKVNKI